MSYRCAQCNTAVNGNSSLLGARRSSQPQPALDSVRAGREVKLCSRCAVVPYAPVSPTQDARVLETTEIGTDEWWDQVQRAHGKPWYQLRAEGLKGR